MAVRRAAAAGPGVRRHPVAWFLILTFVISYGLGIPFNVITSRMLDPLTVTGLSLPRTVTVIGPALAALIVAAAGGGSVTVSGLIRSLRLRRRHIPVVALIAVLGTAITVLAFYAAGVTTDTLLLILPRATPLFVLHVVFQVAIVGIGEELGWRGWLLAHLAGKHSFHAATALTGLAWGVWNLPVFLSAPAIAIPFAVLVASLSVLFSRLWHGTGGNTGVVALAHGFINAPFFFLVIPVLSLPNGHDLVTRAFMLLAGFYALMAIEILVHQRRVWRQRAQRSTAAAGHSG